MSGRVPSPEKARTDANRTQPARGTALRSRSVEGRASGTTARHGGEQPAFGAEGPHPGDLREKVLERPLVFRLREEVPALSAEKRAREGAKVTKAAVAEPGADLSQRVPVLLDVPVLVPQPRLPPCRLGPAVAQDRVPRDPAQAGQLRDRAPQPQREARVRVVDAD